MSHVEKYLLHAVQPRTGKIVQAMWVYDKHTAQCFGASWHMNACTGSANIWIGKELYLGYQNPDYPLPKYSDLLDSDIINDKRKIKRNICEKCTKATSVHYGCGMWDMVLAERKTARKAKKAAGA